MARPIACEFKSMAAVTATKPLASKPAAKKATIRHRGGDRCGIQQNVSPWSGRERQKKTRTPRTENVKNGRPVPIPN